MFNVVVSLTSEGTCAALQHGFALHDWDLPFRTRDGSVAYPVFRFA